MILIILLFIVLIVICSISSFRLFKEMSESVGDVRLEDLDVVELSLSEENYVIHKNQWYKIYIMDFKTKVVMTENGHVFKFDEVSFN